MFYFGSSDLVHFTAESLYSFTNLSLVSQTPTLATTFLFCFYELDFFFFFNILPISDRFLAWLKW